MDKNGIKENKNLPISMLVWKLPAETELILSHFLNKLNYELKYFPQFYSNFYPQKDWSNCYSKKSY